MLNKNKYRVRARFIYEKFTENSDPISDLEIGLYKTKINVKSKKEFAQLMLLVLPKILKRKNIPKDIIDDEDQSSYVNEKYFNKIDNYLQQYVTINNYDASDYHFRNVTINYKVSGEIISTTSMQCHWPYYLRKILVDKGFETTYYI